VAQERKKKKDKQDETQAMPVKVLKELEKLPEEERERALAQINQAYFNQINVGDGIPPLVPADELAKYSQFQEEFPKLFLEEYIKTIKQIREEEKINNEHVRALEQQVVDNDKAVTKDIANENQEMSKFNTRGQWLGAGLVLVILLIGAFAVFKNQIALAKTLFTYTIISIASIFVLSRIPDIRNMIKALKSNKENHS